MLNRWNICAKSILEKVMQKTRKNSENGSQKGSTICENVIKNEVRKLNDFGRLFWRRGDFSATQRLEGEVYLTLKGGTLLGTSSRLYFGAGRLRGATFLIFLIFGTNFLPIKIHLKIDLSRNQPKSEKSHPLAPKG